LSSAELVNQVSLYRGRYCVGGGGVEWGGRSGQQSPRGCKLDSNINTSNNKKKSGFIIFKDIEKNDGKFNK